MPDPESMQSLPPTPALAGPAAEQVPRYRRPETWLAMGGGAIAATGLMLMLFASTATPAKKADDRERLAEVLRAEEFRGLRAEWPKQGDGAATVVGDVRTGATRAKLIRAIDAAQLNAAVHLRVGDDVAQSVADVFRMNGVPAEAEAIGPPAGAVRVKTFETRLDHLTKVEGLAKRDVQGLAAISVENVQPMNSEPERAVVNDPGKRLASIVSGESPYVVTADGTRYFIGALLPTGHRLASISDQQVMLIKDGKVSSLKF